MLTAPRHASGRLAPERAGRSAASPSGPHSACRRCSRTAPRAGCAITTLHAAGYRELGTAAGARGPPFTAPTTQGGGRELDADGMRIDHIPGSDRLGTLCTVCETVTGGAAESASDHYPVTATLDLSWAA